MHEFNLWPSRAQALETKPYINDEAIKALREPERLSDSAMRERINSLLAPKGIRASLFARTNDSGKDEINVEIEQDRDYAGALKRLN